MKKSNVYFLLLFQQLISGGTHIVAKAVVADIDAATLTFLRTVIAALGLYLITRLRSGPLNIERKDWPEIALLGFVGVALNQFLYLYGIKFSTAANGALLYAATPVFVLVFSRMVLKESISPRKTFGILLAFVGIAIVIFERGVDFSSGYAYGNLLILFAVIGWTLFTVLGKRMLVKYGSLRTTTAMMFCGALIISPLGVTSTLSFRFAEISALHWGGVLYLSVGTSIIGYLLWYHALSRIEATKVAVFSNIQPVFATILSLIFLNYFITPAFVTGSIITICAIYITQAS
jgi:drug/metabolite transporter (DMT)-like permease